MDLMEFSMTEGNDTLVGDENFLVPTLMETPVVVNSILKPSNKGNLIQMHTPVQRDPCRKVKFETPHSVKKATPTRYEQIRELDEKENWIERTSIVTKQEHLLHYEYARDILNTLIDNLPLIKSQPTKQSNLLHADSDSETFYNANENIETTIKETCVNKTEGVSAISEESRQNVPQHSDTNRMDESMDCDETNVNITDEPMELDDTMRCADVTVICNKTLLTEKSDMTKEDTPGPVSADVISSPPLPTAKGAYSIDFDNLDNFNPFESKNAVANSPTVPESHISKDKVAETHSEGKSTIECNADEPVEPVGTLTSPETITDLNFDCNTDITSEALPSMEDKDLNLIDPFETKSQVKNSPPMVTDLPTPDEVKLSPVECSLEDSLKPDGQAKDEHPSVTEKDVSATASPKKTLDMECNDPFKTNSKVMNSPVTLTNPPSLSVPDLDNPNPFTTKSKVCNSPDVTSNTVSLENTEAASQHPGEIFAADQSKIEDLADMKFEDIADLTSGIESTTGAPENAFDIEVGDPFSSKSKVANSPLPAPEKADSTKNSNPFATKSKVANSPSPSSLPSTTEDENPFVSKSKVANSPVLQKDVAAPVSQLTKDGDLPPTKQEGDPLTVQTLNLETTALTVKPDVSGKSTKGKTAIDTQCLDDLDPFVNKKSHVSVRSDEDVNVGDSTSANPSKTESCVPISSTETVSELTSGVENPFVTKSKVCNSPAAPEGNPFATKSKVANSPLPQEQFTTHTSDSADCFITKSRGGDSPGPTNMVSQQTGGATGLEPKVANLAESQNVGVRGNTLPEESAVPDFPDDEFKPATESIFNDASVWAALEKFGNSTTDKVSDLARMSLYVKFDPLVDLPSESQHSINLKRASILNTPRTSLFGKSIADICNPEESMLLIGTPPQQRSHQLIRQASLGQNSMHTGGSQPTTPKAFKPAQLDLLCANTPPRSVRKSSTPAATKTMLSEDPADNLVGGSDENIVEVLTYTEKDMSMMKASLFLEFQGQKIAMEQDSSKQIEKMKQKLEEQEKKHEKTTKDLKQMGWVIKEYETLIDKLIAGKESATEKCKELTKERDQALQETQALEKAFGDLHLRNEKVKDALSGYVKNEATLKAFAEDVQKKLIAVKKESKEKITELSQQLSKVQSALESQTTKFEAKEKRDKMQIESLQKQVDQKMEENKELTQLCDKLLS